MDEEERIELGHRANETETIRLAKRQGKQPCADCGSCGVPCAPGDADFIEHRQAWLCLTHRVQRYVDDELARRAKIQERIRGRTMEPATAERSREHEYAGSSGEN